MTALPKFERVEPVAAPRVEPIPLDRIKDGGAQMRVEMRPETVNEYAADMLDGAAFPPIVVFYDGCDFWLADGFHRVEAGRKISREMIVAEIRKAPRGTRSCMASAPMRSRITPHAGGQAACGRAIAQGSGVGAVVGSQDRRGRSG